MNKLLSVFISFVITLSLSTTSLAASRGDSSDTNNQTRVVERQVEAVEVSVINPDSMLPTPDNRVVNPDSMLPTPDNRVVDPDSMRPTPDVGVINPDSMLPTPDNRVVNPDSMRPTPDVGVLNPDSMLPEPDSSNVERTGSVDSNPTPHPKPQEIRNIEKDFINNLQKAYKIQLQFDENRLANIKEDIATEWESAKQAIAQMSGSDSATMYLGYANAKPTLKLDDQVLKEWGIDFAKDFKEQHGLEDQGLAKQIAEIAAVQKIWDDYYAKVANIEAWYQTLFDALMAQMASLSQKVQDNYDAAIAHLKLAREEAILLAEDQYKSDLAEAAATMTQELEDAAKKYHEDLAAANDAEEEEAAMNAYLAAQAAIQEKYAMDVAAAKASRDAKIALAWEVFLSEAKLYAPPSVKQIMTLFEPYFDALQAMRIQLLKAAEQERDEALAALED